MSRDIAPERLAELLDRQDIADCLTRFTRGMEAAFLKMYERRRAGLAPDHITVVDD